jgi:hypothetical protein
VIYSQRKRENQFRHRTDFGPDPVSLRGFDLMPLCSVFVMVLYSAVLICLIVVGHLWQGGLLKGYVRAIQKLIKPAARLMFSWVVCLSPLNMMTRRVESFQWPRGIHRGTNAVCLCLQSNAKTL